MKIFRLVDITDEDVYCFKIRLNRLSIIVTNRLAPPAKCQAELDSIKKNKISTLPAFFDAVHNKLQKQLDEWIKDSKDDYAVTKVNLKSSENKKDYYSRLFTLPVIYSTKQNKAEPQKFNLFKPGIENRRFN